MSVQRKENPNQYGDIIVWGKEERARSSERQERSVKKTCMQGAPLGYKNPQRSRAVCTACLPDCLPLSPLKA